MPITFSRTMRSLERDDFRFSGLLIFLILSLGWGIWFFRAEVTVFEVSPTARLEVDRTALVVETIQSGSVAVNHLVLGKNISKGDMLLELDATGVELYHREAETQVFALEARILALEKERKARVASLKASHDLSNLMAREGGSQQRVSEIQSRIAGEEARAMEKLHSEGGLSDLELKRTHSAEDRNKAQETASKAGSKRMVGERLLQERQEEAELVGLDEDIENVRGLLAREKVKVERLTYEIGLHHIRAVESGRVAEVADLRVGSYVEQGEVLA